MNARRVIVITGASSGIGRALAERAVRSGDAVVAVGRRADRLAELQAQLAGAHGKLHVIELELRTLHAAESIVNETLRTFGRLDVLVNNAGGVAVGPVSVQSDGALQEQFTTHAIVPLALVRESLPSLRAARGHIFFVGSGVARIPVGGLGAYPPAKAAVRSIARIVRNELRADEIAVTYVDPGAVATEFMTRAGFSGPPPNLAASPHEVARRIYRALGTRQSVVNAVPWQTALVALGELMPAVVDALLERAPQIVGGEVIVGEAEPAPLAAPHVALPSANGERAPSDPFAAALHPHASRMRKLNLSTTFVSKLLVPGRTFDVDEVALHWAGMPNKNERALTQSVLDALAEAGFLSQAEGKYTVVRGLETAAD